jgi:hypothetical protein
MGDLRDTTRGKPASDAPTIELAGNTYRFGRMDLADFIQFGRYVADLRPNPLVAIEAVRHRLAADVYDAAVKRAVHELANPEPVTTEELRRYLDTIEGTVRYAWFSLSKNHPELASGDDLVAILAGLSPAELAAVAAELSAKMAQVSGMGGLAVMQRPLARESPGLN